MITEVVDQKLGAGAGIALTVTSRSSIFQGSSRVWKAARQLSAARWSSKVTYLHPINSCHHRAQQSYGKRQYASYGTPRSSATPWPGARAGPSIGPPACQAFFPPPGRSCTRSLARSMLQSPPRDPAPAAASDQSTSISETRNVTETLVGFRISKMFLKIIYSQSNIEYIILDNISEQFLNK